MNALETILLRKSIPLMEEPNPNKQQLKKIYKAGLRAPDHGGLNPWKFIEVSGDDRIKLGKKFVKITKKVKKNPSIDLLNKVKKAPLRAPLIIIVIANIKKDSPIPKIEQILFRKLQFWILKVLSIILELKINTGSLSLILN